MTSRDGLGLLVNVLLDEEGADRRRLRRLSADLGGALQGTGSCEVRFLSLSAEGNAKGVAEYLPGGLVLIVGLTASTARLSHLLHVWLMRDRARSAKLGNAKTGEFIEINGMSREDIAGLIEIWREGGQDE